MEQMNSHLSISGGEKETELQRTGEKGTAADTTYGSG